MHVEIYALEIIIDLMKLLLRCILKVQLKN